MSDNDGTLQQLDRLMHRVLRRKTRARMQPRGKTIVGHYGNVRVYRYDSNTRRERV